MRQKEQHKYTGPKLGMAWVERGIEKILLGTTELARCRAMERVREFTG